MNKTIALLAKDYISVRFLGVNDGIQCQLIDQGTTSFIAGGDGSTAEAALIAALRHHEEACEKAYGKARAWCMRALEAP